MGVGVGELIVRVCVCVCVCGSATYNILRTRPSVDGSKGSHSPHPTEFLRLILSWRESVCVYVVVFLSWERWYCVVV